MEHAAEGESSRRHLQAGCWDLVLLHWWPQGQDGLGLLHSIRMSGLSNGQDVCQPSVDPDAVRR